MTSELGDECLDHLLLKTAKPMEYERLLAIVKMCGSLIESKAMGEST